MESKLIRQGDVLLVLMPEKNGTVRGKKRQLIAGRAILARGETSGHEHVILGNAEVYDLDQPGVIPGYGAWSATMVLVNGRAQLAHLIGNQPTGEHAPIDLEPGLYWQLPQWEYAPDAIRRVTD